MENLQLLLPKDVLEPSPPPRKRRRLDDCEDSDISLIPCEDAILWHEDGNIILVCDLVGFRVHRGVLASHSPVWGDMLVVGSPAHDDTYDGCPVVHLQDSPQDMYHVLKMVYFRSYGQDKSLLSFSVYEGLLRMARKYDIEELRKEITAQLIVLFPPHFDSYVSSSPTLSRPPNYHPYLAVEIALNFDIPTILPLALYLSVISLDVKARINGYELSDGTRIKPSQTVLYRIMCFETAWRAHIDRDDVMTNWFTEEECSDDECGGQGDSIMRCQRVWFSSLHEKNIFVHNYEDENPGVVEHLCASCMASLRSSLSAYRELMWSRLPSCTGFGWTSWKAIPVSWEGNGLEAAEGK